MEQEWGLFFPKDDRSGIDGIIECGLKRFEEYRNTIERVRKFPEVVQGEAVGKEEEERRRRIQRVCRNLLPNSAVDWLDAVVAITRNEERAFPPILGTGGNEGHLNYTRNFMENLVKLFIKPNKRLPVRDLLRNALFATPVSGFEKAAAGQFDPGRAGGFNQGQEIKTEKVPTNPWNFLLTVEGAVSWASGLHRRQGTYTRAYLSSPFTVYPSAVGFNSAADKDQAIARAAEIWAPIWDHPATSREIEVLVREGRAQLGRGPAENGLQFAQAAASLGTDRGIAGFVRFSLLKRRGDNYVALPVGRFPVGQRKNADLLEQVTPLIERVDQFLRGFRESPPFGASSARRRYDDAVYEFLLKGGEERFRRVVAALGQLRKMLLLRPRDSRVHLASQLAETWIEACGKTPEVRIAAAVAGIRDIQSSLTRGDSSFAWEGNKLPARLSNVLARRLLDARRKTAWASPLWSHFVARTADVGLLLRNRIDEVLTENLLFAFTLVRRDTPPEEFRNTWNKREVDQEAIPSSYYLLRMLFDPTVKTLDGEPMKGEPRVMPLLRAGRIGEACGLAKRRLRISGFPVVDAEYLDFDDGPRLAAALLIPVSSIQNEAECVGILKRDEAGG